MPWEITGLLAIGGFLGWFGSSGPLGRAVRARRERVVRAADDRAEMLERLEAMQDEMDRLRGELAETHERLDFAERLLPRGRDPRLVTPS